MRSWNASRSNFFAHSISMPLVLCEHLRLQSACAILRRHFCRRLRRAPAPKSVAGPCAELVDPGIDKHHHACHTENPAPNQSVTVNVTSYAENLDTSRIEWYVDNKLVSSGIGKKEIMVQSPVQGGSMSVLARNHHQCRNYYADQRHHTAEHHIAPLGSHELVRAALLQGKSLARVGYVYKGRGHTGDQSLERHRQVG